VALGVGDVDCVGHFVERVVRLLEGERERKRKDELSISIESFLTLLVCDGRKGKM